MKWYLVTKKIGGKPYLYRQRTYREGGRVRTQSQYVGASGDLSVSTFAANGSMATRKATQPATLQPVVSNTLLHDAAKSLSPINPLIKFGNPFWPREQQLNIQKAQAPIKHKGISISAMKGEYARLGKRLEQLGLSGNELGKIRLIEGKKSGWKRHKYSYSVTFSTDQKGSGRNRLKRTYRIALAHAFLDQIEIQSPAMYDCFRTLVDRSWFNTKYIITCQILKSRQPHKAWLTLQFLWSGALPKAMEKQLGNHNCQKLSPLKPGSWRDEAADLIADVIQRGYKPSLKRLSKDRSKARANAKRALTAYHKLGPIARLTAKGRKKWQTYKKHEAKFLLAHHRKSRLEMLEPFLGDLPKG